MGIRDWVKPKAHQVDPARILLFAREVVASFGESMERVGSSIYDEKELPYQKEVILKSLHLVYAITSASEMKEGLLVAAHSLAFFQPDVGPEPLHMAGMPIEELNELRTKDPVALQDAYLAHGEEMEKFHRLFPAVLKEAESMVAFVKSAT
jgi:hypothetical protein